VPEILEPTFISAPVTGRMTPVAMTVSFKVPRLTVAVRRRSVFDSASPPGHAYRPTPADITKTADAMVQ
jgi:hypothetical protein